MTEKKGIEFIRLPGNQFVRIDSLIAVRKHRAKEKTFYSDAIPDRVVIDYKCQNIANSLVLRCSSESDMAALLLSISNQITKSNLTVNITSNIRLLDDTFGLRLHEK